MKIKEFAIKNKHYIIISLFVIASILSLIFMGKVVINYSISDYLDDSTETKISLEIIEDEFGMTSDIQVMVENVSVEQALEIKNVIKNVDNVLNVSFNEDDVNNYKNDKALYVVLVQGNNYSEVANKVASDIKKELKNNDTSYGGAITENKELRDAIQGEMLFIIIIAIALVFVIMLFTSKSWIEPILLLGTSGIAVLLNMGTNAIFDDISYITNAVAAILQLALSVDYSIVLIHKYRALKEEGLESNKAMTQSVKGVFTAVSASALTTIAGLLALLFMTLGIGFDIGIVLIKGIVISAITALTLLPTVVLLFEKPLEKTKKKDLAIKSESVAKISFKFGKFILPIALVLVIVCGIFQSWNTYSFTDSKFSGTKIKNTFGETNSIIVLYEKNIDPMVTYNKEQEFANIIGGYRNSKSKPVLKSYTAYTNTVREVYTIEVAEKKLQMPKADIELLFAMHDIYTNINNFTFQPKEFVEYTNFLIETDPDLNEYIDINTSSTMKKLGGVDSLANGDFTAIELYNLISNEPLNVNNISEFAIKQMYGLHYYNNIAEPKIELNEFIKYLSICANNNQDFSKFLIQYKELVYLGAIIAGMNAQHEKMPISNYVETYNTLKQSYSYTEFLPAFNKVIKFFNIPSINVSNNDIQQIYISYFYENNKIPSFPLNGRYFVDYVLEQSSTNETIKGQLGESGIKNLNALVFSHEFLKDTSYYNYEDMTEVLQELQNNTNLSDGPINLSREKISGVYIKHNVNNELSKNHSLMAFELLNFVLDNMNTNVLIKNRMDSSAKQKVQEAKRTIDNAEGMFNSENYTRMILSVNLPKESEDSTEFINYLTKKTKAVFGDSAHICGEIVSTNDLKQTFDSDNLIITLFTIISIFIIVLLLFKSLSIPIVLVAVIQGAIWVTMSLSLFTGSMFFMSYIIATCILMGATIDYGILMCSTYVNYRKTLNKKESLLKALEATMPTVFTSGSILTICGFIIGLIASQNSIASVGFLIGKGTLSSILLIVFVLPSILYLFDKFVLKLTLKKKGD